METKTPITNNVAASESSSTVPGEPPYRSAAITDAQAPSRPLRAEIASVNFHGMAVWDRGVRWNWADSDSPSWERVGAKILTEDWSVGAGDGDLIGCSDYRIWYFKSVEDQTCDERRTLTKGWMWGKSGVPYLSSRTSELRIALA